MELQDKDNIYQNNIAILSMSRVDEESGRRTMQFNPPSQMINSQYSLIERKKKCLSVGLYNFVISALIVICLCTILGVVITTLKSNKLKEPTASSLLALPHNDSDIDLEPITLNEILTGYLKPDLFNGSWITDKKIVFYDEFNNLCTLDVSLMKKEIIIRNTTILLKQLDGELLSKNLDYLLSAYDISKTFRHSTLSKYKIYDIKNDSFTYLLLNEEEGENSFIQYAEWGPYGTQLIFVHQNNLYYKSDVNAIPIQLTSTGIPNVIYNGYTDWVYEEEILESEKAFWVSPDGQHLVYATINDSEVDIMSWPYYGEYYNISSNQYPSEVALRYPKPGRDNPTVEIFVLNLNDSVDNIEVRRLDPPNEISKHDYYFTAIGWINNESVSITWLTRGQNYSAIDVCDKNQQWICNTSFTVESAHSWIDLYDPPISASNHNSYLIRLPELISDESGYFQHVALINMTDRNVRYLTLGHFDVLELVAYNQRDETVYFLSTLHHKSEVRHLMAVSIHDEKNLLPICLTCNLGNSCLYNQIFMSSSSDYYVLQCEGPFIPKVEVRKTRNNALIAVLENNDALKEKMSTKAIPTVKKLKVKTSQKYFANVQLLLPPEFNETRKYPVLIEVYGGPGSQLVTDKFRVNHWGSHLASNLSVIYARIDGRGSDNRGSKYLHEIYKNMGNVEVMDVITIARFFRDNITYIDGNSIGIWGWSYGGYVTLMSLALDYSDPVFKCGIAVAPVTNWMYYDSVYVERYMGWPFNNIEEYDRSNFLNKVHLLKNEKLLLAFGTADDNVHSQHSMLLISKLNDLGIDYETQVYPDNDHSLRGSTVHLYQKMNDFLERCFNI